jgi:hypothetical protein
MKLSESAQAFIDYCYKLDGTPCSISSWFKNEYTLYDDKIYKFDEKVWSEIKSSNLVKVIHEYEKYVTYGGIATKS